MHLIMPPPANALISQSIQQPRLVCTWSAHAPQAQFGPSPLFPLEAHTLTPTSTGELFLFGGYAHGRASGDLYVISTRDFSTTLLQTSGSVPTPRYAHRAALIDTTTLLICGGKTKGGESVLHHDSIYLLNLESREWSCVVPAVSVVRPGGCCYHTSSLVGSKLFVFGGQIDGKAINDMWTLDLSCLKSQPSWESCGPTPGNKKPLPRSSHVSVTVKDCIIIFGGYDSRHFYNDTWSFDTSTRKWTELQCTGSIPSPCADHAAVLVDDVMYVFGGFSVKEGQSDDLYALQLSTRRWFKFHNVGQTPHRRSYHAMASVGTRVLVLGGYLGSALPDEVSLIHVFDTKDIKYPEPEDNAVNPDKKTIQLVRESSVSLTQEQPQQPESFSSEAHGASHPENTTPAVSDRPASIQITDERNPSPCGHPLEHTGRDSKPRCVPEGDVSEMSTEKHTKFATPHSSSEGEVTRLEPEIQLSVSLAAQTERDQRVAQLTEELAPKSVLLEQAEANARLELVDMKSKLKSTEAKLDESLPSFDQQTGRLEEELANVRAKLEAKESELESLRLRLADAEKGSTESKAETLRCAQEAKGSVNRDEDQVTRDHRLAERVRALEAQMMSKWLNEKSIQEMECSNE